MKPLPAHSIFEAELHLMVQPCEACDSGPLQVTDETIEEAHIDSIVCVTSRCTSCGRSADTRFRIDSRWAERSDPPVVNATAEPSRLIDVAQWLTLYHILLKRSRESADRVAGRRLAYEAGLCITEALRFYEPDNELPPASAFFSEHSRDQARAHPTHFARERLVGLRSGLPNLRSIPVGSRSVSAWKWWKFWQKPHSTADSDATDCV